MDRQQLTELTARFMDAFNRNDLATVMSFFAEDAVYDEFNGKRNEGRAAIRAAFTPQFSGVFGTMQFLDGDLFIDADADKVMASWRGCDAILRLKTMKDTRTQAQTASTTSQVCGVRDRWEQRTETSN